jgi:cation diffusion facilitator CzcD-associated flavoprotein CzcO
MFACPTEALVMFPEGTTAPPLRLPEMDEWFQTATKGQYLIGEVAGKPLVKNAANLGRLVIEHMRAGGLRPSRTREAGAVDVAIVGSGRAGLSAALTCIQRGLSYVVLDKEQIISSTIARYPKGKLVMAEPYDTENLSLLPVFDSSKEVLLPIWSELISRLDVNVRLGESVESVKAGDGGFSIKTTVASYRAQRVVLAIGTRGKPRTLQVPGENLPKVASLLEDPDLWRGQAVLVVGGGDSAVEGGARARRRRRARHHLVPRQLVLALRAQEPPGHRGLRRRGAGQGQAAVDGGVVLRRRRDPAVRRWLAEAVSQPGRVRAHRRRSAGGVAREDGRPLHRARSPVPARALRRAAAAHPA